MKHTHTIIQCRYCDRVIAQCCITDKLESYLVRPETCEICEKKLRFVLAQIPVEALEQKQETSCCQARQKIIVSVSKVVPESECGIPDSILADYINHGTDSPGGKPVLTFQYCPWCGTERDPDGETRVTETA